MKVLVINTGSSSIKYQLFSMQNKTVLAHGILEKIGESDGQHSYYAHSISRTKFTFNDQIKDHETGLNKIVALLTDEKHGVIKNKSEVKAIGHRVVHGGEMFQSPVVIDHKVLGAIRENIPLAPLHNPANVTGIEISQRIFPKSIQVAVFDTAFHHTLPPKAYLYALPYALYKSMKIRRYGFHGTSHHFVAQAAAKLLKKQLADSSLITIHLGNGGSVTAIKQGISVDTSMGMTPLEGLIMGTRSGDIDPAIHHFLMTNSQMSIEDINTILNKESGLKGICGLNDMRDILKAAENKDDQAKLALEMYNYRIKKYIGSYLAILETVDAIVFTAGIGENSMEIRYSVCKGLEKLGINIDLRKNSEADKGAREIQEKSSKIKIMVVPTDEELKIALETKKLIE